MLYYLFEWLDRAVNLPGAGLFNFLSFRSAIAFLFSLLFALFIGKKIISILRRQQIGETIRDLGLNGQNEKAGTPTMGGIIIILSTLIPVLLFAKLFNIYVVLMLLTTVWMGIIGFLDDYKKVMKKNKEGLKGRFKVIGQVSLGILVGAVLYFNPHVTIREINDIKDNVTFNDVANEQVKFSSPEQHSLKTTIPFFKNNEFDYSQLISWAGDNYKQYAWLIFIPIVILIITAVSNGANLTDGIDGLAAGTSAIQAGTIGIFAWVSGNIIFAGYLNIMYIPDIGELSVFIAAFIGALIGFLWYNAYPAQIFMGDTGSLTIGGIIAVMAICVRKELLIPIISGIFLIENLSVVMQVSYFKYTKKKYGEGRRIFLMSPLHHHYQKKGWHESKIVARFMIVGLILAALSIVTLKLR